MLRLEMLRKEKNLSQNELAKKINMTQQRISAYEKGKREPDIETLKQFANFFQCTMDYLTGKSNIRYQQTNISNANNIIQIPVVGKIAAGQPILAEEYIEGYLPVDPNIYGITTPEDYFYLKVAGQSMNLKVKNGDYALVHKQDYAENGDIVVAIVNGDEEATLKKFKKLNEQFVLLEPMSSDPTIEAITVDLRDTNFKIVGKAIGQFGKF